MTLLGRLRAVLPPGVAIAEAPAQSELLGPEKIAAVPARRLEFARGRAAARQAMLSLGQPPLPVPMGPDRAPIWPPDLTGSISHCDGACMAIVGFRRVWGGLGLDIEPDRPLPAELWSTVLHPSEQAALGPDPARRALLVFVIKEAVYKAQYALTAQLFDFSTLHVTVDGPRYLARFCRPVAPFDAGFEIHGDWLGADGLVAATCFLPADLMR